MTDQEPTTPDEPTPDETFTWTEGASSGEHATGGAGADSTSGSSTSAASGAGATATAILESIRDAVDDLAERATPTVREFSARAAEMAADAADKAAPYVRRAGDVTADAGGKLATKSRSWAAEIRASMADHDAGAPSTEGASPAADTPTPTPPPASDADAGRSDDATPA